jgi:ESS family glutamate:Na+ symporter
MLGSPQVALADSFRTARPNIIMGHAFAWGQHWVGTLCALFIFDYFYADARFLAPLIAIGFQGGHGTAAGLKKTFEELGFQEGVDLGLGVATGGVLAGFLSGIILLRVLQRIDKHESAGRNRSVHQTAASLPSPPDEGSGSRSGQKIESIVSQLTIQGGFIAMTITAGWILLQGLQRLEQMLLADTGQGLIRYLPLFPVVLIASMLVNAVFRKFHIFNLLKRKSIEQIGALALDILIVAAIATLNLSVLYRYSLALTGLIGIGILWNIGLFLIAGPLLYPRIWYVRALPDYGGATATTASGILLAGIADPENRTGNKTAYTLKQPFYEPFMGGGFVTALSLPVINAVGLWPYFGGLTVIMAGIGLLIIQSGRRNPD